MTQVTLTESVEKLTRPRTETVTRDDGTTEKVHVDGLIQVLRDEMFGGSNRGGAPAARARLTINAPAYDLYTEIDRQAAQVLSQVTRQVPGVEKLEGVISLWSAAVSDRDIVTVTYPETILGAEGKHVVLWDDDRKVEAANLAAQWVRRIEDLLDPPRTAEILAACIACGQREVWRNVDGEHQKTPALNFIRDRQTGDSVEARCLACNTVWYPYQYLFLAEQIARNEKSGEAS